MARYDAQRIEQRGIDLFEQHDAKTFGALGAEGLEMTYRFDTMTDNTGIPALLRAIGDLNIEFKDLNTSTSSLEDIFVSLVSNRGGVA
jgi:hypothetical protein